MLFCCKNRLVDEDTKMMLQVLYMQEDPWAMKHHKQDVVS